MPESIDWPRMGAPRRSRRFLLLIVAVLAIIVFGGRTALSYYVDLLWSKSLGRPHLSFCMVRFSL